ncbi:YSIRK-type signal peptide-containing protein [Lactobacillus jensenii]|uniref:YSIRK-type signal peptide-containing protein n=6 Tax=Lactobacillus mulieris TaxID=2508708 RepID=UPI0002E5D7CC|nr:YSIRK-type signal peptide-containing protein [Lactobacillus mulieris]EEU21267.2 YSIRK family Gram-positive signal peptide [Lactobacillus jensenii 27-2-CHN]KAA9366134.1 YSIRK-type signal peptide-containing protein [Lactobacillus jensenii]KAA9371554.1 YSIRK-type signal peptide-containing protein [Lactobacillus jensenii]TVV21580.1 YSIRK-type signal peptide-containing protein [Lactobacillus jensenii]WEB31412.1 YSIRK-type signal peptide-containing protein [Lactobacillus mulieris]
MKSFFDIKQRFSIRKLSVGAVSVLLGLTFISTAQTVNAATTYTVNADDSIEQTDPVATFWDGSKVFTSPHQISEKIAAYDGGESYVKKSAITVILKSATGEPVTLNENDHVYVTARNYNDKNSSFKFDLASLLKNKTITANGQSHTFYVYSYGPSQTHNPAKSRFKNDKRYYKPGQIFYLYPAADYNAKFDAQWAQATASSSDHVFYAVANNPAQGRNTIDEIDVNGTKLPRQTLIFYVTEKPKYDQNASVPAGNYTAEEVAKKLVKNYDNLSNGGVTWTFEGSNNPTDTKTLTSGQAVKLVPHYPGYENTDINKYYDNKSESFGSDISNGKSYLYSDPGKIQSPVKTGDAIEVKVSKDFNSKIDQVPVKGDGKLTDDQKQAVRENIKKANPDLNLTDDQIKVSDDGTTTVSTADGINKTLTPDQTIKRYDLGDPLTTPDFNDQVEKEVIKGNDKLTDDQKQKIKDNIKKANPEMELTDGDITVDDDGTTTVNTKDGSKKTLTPDQTIKRYDLGDPLTTPDFNDQVEKEVIKGNDKLTDDQKQKIKDNIKKANPGMELTDGDITVDDDGTTTVNTKDGSKKTLTPDQTIKRYDLGDPLFDPEFNDQIDKEVVKGDGDLTDNQKQAVKDNIKKANPKLNLSDDQITVDKDGKATVKLDGNVTKTLTPDQTIKRYEKGEPLENTGDTDNFNKNIDKVPVEGQDKLTDKQKEEVKDSIKKANQNSPIKDIDVKDDGRTIVTFDDGTQVELTPEETIKRFEKGEPLTSPEFNSNIDKVLVKGEGKLTDDQKQAVRENIKKANPDLNLTDDKITVGDDGKATVDLGGNVIKNLIPDQTIKRYDVGDPLISPEFNDNIDKVPVKDGDKLTDDQKQKVKDNIKKANPGMELTDGDITVDDDGTTTVNTKDGSKKTLTPDQTTNRYNLVDPLINTGNADSFNKNIDKVPVEGQRDLTEQEKERIKQNIKDANPNSPIKDIDVKDDGRTIVTLDDGTQIELTPDQTVNRYEKGEPLENTGDADSFNKNIDKVPVEGQDKLTDKQKDEVKENIKKANPNSPIKDIDVKDDGRTIITFDDGTQTELTPDQTVNRYEKGEPLTTPDFNDQVEKEVIKGNDKLTDDQKQKIKDNIKKANPGMELTDGDIIVDDDGTTTVNTKDGSKKTLTPDQTIKRYDLSDPLFYDDTAKDRSANDDKNSDRENNSNTDNDSSKDSNSDKANNSDNHEDQSNNKNAQSINGVKDERDATISSKNDMNVKTNNKQSLLPQTGNQTSSLQTLGLAVLSLLTLSFFKKKKQD